MVKQKNVKLENDFLLDVAVVKGSKGGKGEEIHTTKSGTKVRFNPPEKGGFRQYKDLIEIAQNITAELIDKMAYKQAKSLDDIPYNKIITEGFTFFMSSDKTLQRTGLLSLFPAVFSALMLYEAMNDNAIEKKCKVTKGMNDDVKEKLKSEADDYKTRREELEERILSGVKAIFKIIYSQGEDCPVFDASPYEYGSSAFYKGTNKKDNGIDGLDGRSYIDSITWAVPVFLKIMHVKKTIQETNTQKKREEYLFDEVDREKAKKLTQWCLNYIIEAVLTDKDKDGNEIPKGWSYTRLAEPKEEARSLYFTYAASTLYLSFAAEYQDILRAFKRIESNFEEYIKEKCKDEESNPDTCEKIQKLLERKYWEADFKGELEEAIKITNEWITNDSNNEDEAERFRKAYEEIKKPANKELIAEMIYFNDDKRIGSDGKDHSGVKKEDAQERIGALTYLKWTLETISKELWENIGEKLADNFLYDDFIGKEAQTEAIESGGQTNALFAGLMQIGIILNSAYDLIVKTVSQKEYENMQEAFLLHVQRTQRYYEKLEAEGMSFAVESFILRFSEKIEKGDEYKDSKDSSRLTDKELAEKLRKQSIRICSLTPMLLKTYNLIAYYLIAYPQKQMGTSLTRIDKKRYRDKQSKDYRWFWESDDYHAGSNYYYIAAVFDFYEYYDMYEKQYIDNRENTIDAIIEQSRYSEGVLQFCEEVENEKIKLENEMGNQKKQHEAALQAKENEIQQLKDTNATALGLVEKVREVVESSTFGDPEFLKRIINGIRKQLAEDLVKRYQEHASKEEEGKKILEEIAKPLDPDDATLFSLLQALATDIILPSAIKAKTEGGHKVKNLGDEGFAADAPKAWEFALLGSKALITGGLINKLFANIFAGQFTWPNKENNK